MGGVGRGQQRGREWGEWDEDRGEEGRRGAEVTRGNLKDAVKVGDNGHLLVELRGLGEVGVALEVVHLEHVRPALAARQHGT